MFEKKNKTNTKRCFNNVFFRFRDECQKQIENVQKNFDTIYVDYQFVTFYQKRQNHTFVQKFVRLIHKKNILFKRNYKIFRIRQKSTTNNYSNKNSLKH